MIILKSKKDHIYETAPPPLPPKKKEKKKEKKSINNLKCGEVHVVQFLVVGW